MNDAIKIELDDQVTAETLCYAAKKLELRAVWEPAGELILVSVFVADALQAWQFGFDTADLMRRYYIDKRKRDRDKQFNRFIDGNKKFIEQYFAGWSKIGTTYINQDLKAQARVFVEQVKLEGLYSSTTIAQDIMSHFCRHYREHYLRNKPTK